MVFCRLWDKGAYHSFVYEFGQLEGDGGIPPLRGHHYPCQSRMAVRVHNYRTDRLISKGSVTVGEDNLQIGRLTAGVPGGRSLRACSPGRGEAARAVAGVRQYTMLGGCLPGSGGGDEAAGPSGRLKEQPTTSSSRLSSGKERLVCAPDRTCLSWPWLSCCCSIFIGTGSPFGPRWTMTCWGWAPGGRGRTATGRGCP